jgi:hypothetical protein
VTKEMIYKLSGVWGKFPTWIQKIFEEQIWLVRSLDWGTDMIGEIFWVSFGNHLKSIFAWEYSLKWVLHFLYGSICNCVCFSLLGCDNVSCWSIIQGKHLSRLAYENSWISVPHQSYITPQSHFT